MKIDYHACACKPFPKVASGATDALRAIFIPNLSMKTRLSALIHWASLGIIAIGLIVCTSVMPVSADPAISPPNSAPALLQGMRIGGSLFTEPHTACVQAVDTRLIPNNEELWNQELRIDPGPHYISVRYYYRVTLARTVFPVVLKPGASYQVRCTYRHKGVDLWIADQASGKPVTPIRHVVPVYSKRRQMAMYDWPTGGGAYEQGPQYGPGSATIFPNQNTGVESLQLDALRELAFSLNDVDHPELFNHGSVNKGEVTIGQIEVNEGKAVPTSPPAPASDKPNQ